MRTRRFTSDELNKIIDRHTELPIGLRWQQLNGEPAKASGRRRIHSEVVVEIIAAAKHREEDLADAEHTEEPKWTKSEEARQSTRQLQSMLKKMSCQQSVLRAAQSRSLEDLSPVPMETSETTNVEYEQVMQACL